MAKEKIVRCTIAKTGDGSTARSVRYVPLEIFQLWKHLMTHRHGFTIHDDYASLWFDIDGDPNVTYAASNYERVVRLSLWVYSESTGMFREITRYFPHDSYGEIKPRFMAHYSSYFTASKFPPRTLEIHGVWLKPHDA
jgi:hypothetical protein